MLHWIVNTIASKKKEVSSRAPKDRINLFMNEAVINDAIDALHSGDCLRAVVTY